MKNKRMHHDTEDKHLLEQHRAVATGMAGTAMAVPLFDKIRS